MISPQTAVPSSGTKESSTPSSVSRIFSMMPSSLPMTLGRRDESSSRGNTGNERRADGVGLAPGVMPQTPPTLQGSNHRNQHLEKAAGK